MGNIAGARLVAQTERCRWHSRGADGAQLEHGISTVRTRSERGWWHRRSAVGGTVGARMVAQLRRGWWRRRSTVGGAAGARLVVQTERGGSAVRARTERGGSAVRARSERGRKKRNGWKKNCRGGGRTGNNLNCCCFPERGSSAGGCRGREDQRAETHFPWPYGLTISTGWTLDLSSGAVRYLVREKSMDFTSMQRIFWFQAVR